jgi:hypothetical protein
MKNRKPCEVRNLPEAEISENPAESRKSRPPGDAWTASTTQRFMAVGRSARSLTSQQPQIRSRFQRRIIARVHGCARSHFSSRPELADLGIGLDRGVDELVAFFSHRT